MSLTWRVAHLASAQNGHATDLAFEANAGIGRALSNCLDIFNQPRNAHSRCLHSPIDNGQMVQAFLDQETDDAV